MSGFARRVISCSVRVQSKQVGHSVAGALCAGVSRMLAHLLSAGQHLGKYPTPAKEDDPRVPGPMFYYDLEDYLAERWVAAVHTACGFYISNLLESCSEDAVHCASGRHGIVCAEPCPV